MKLIVFTLAAVLLAGCESWTPLTPVSRGEARQALFVWCMELATKIPGAESSSVSDVVDACSTQSAYITNYVR